jgi:hypothetical protein
VHLHALGKFHGGLQFLHHQNDFCSQCFFKFVSCIAVLFICFCNPIGQQIDIRGKFGIDYNSKNS